jgi:hypothetical protein
LSGTLFSGTHLDYRQILLLVALLNLRGGNLSRTFISRAVGVSEATIRRVEEKLNILMSMNSRMEAPDDGKKRK